LSDCFKLTSQLRLQGFPFHHALILSLLPQLLFPQTLLLLTLPMLIRLPSQALHLQSQSKALSLGSSKGTLCLFQLRPCVLKLSNSLLFLGEDGFVLGFVILSLGESEAGDAELML
jgi:hypothetical protein